MHVHELAGRGDERIPVDLDRRIEPRHRATRLHRLHERAAAQPHRRAGLQVGRDGAEGHERVGEAVALGGALEVPAQALAAEQRAQRQGRAGRVVGELGEAAVDLVRREAHRPHAADAGPGAAARDRVDRHADLRQRLEHADVGEAA